MTRSSICRLQGPRRSAIKYSPVLTLSEMLTSMYSRNITPIIYFEALECDVRELESKKSLKLAFLDDGNKLIGEVRVLVPKDAKMSQVIQAAKEKRTSLRMAHRIESNRISSQSLIHSFTHSLIHSFTHSLIHSTGAN